MKQIIVKQLVADENKVVEDAQFIDDLGADSLIQLRLLWL